MVRARSSNQQQLLYTFGSPRVGDHAFARHVSARVPHAFRVATDGDIVTGVPPKRMLPTFGYKHVGVRVVLDMPPSVAPAPAPAPPDAPKSGGADADGGGTAAASTAVSAAATPTADASPRDDDDGGNEERAPPRGSHDARETGSGGLVIDPNVVESAFRLRLVPRRAVSHVLFLSSKPLKIETFGSTQI